MVRAKTTTVLWELEVSLSQAVAAQMTRRVNMAVAQANENEWQVSGMLVRRATMAESNVSTNLKPLCVASAVNV